MTARKRQSIVAAGDRRTERRFALILGLSWKLIHRNRVMASGAGHTIDISRHGVRFDSCPRISAGKKMEISIAWPVLLHGVAPIKLVIGGPVVRCDDACTVVRIVRHEFRTARRSQAAGALTVKREEPPRRIVLPRKAAL
ncbi:MAG TPA: hypothetical protein VMU19_13600 [Bryobacteraceae bacterium]|nr:hypothetical protein [Bryobacteraceae bacterium]